MKTLLLFVIIILVSSNAVSDSTDSVYSWGAWAEGIKPAAGPTYKNIPPPIKRPDINFRPNENSAFLREATTANRPVFTPAPDVASAPQVPGVVIAPTNTPTTPRGQF